jgi:AraC-like DNA-binding protein
MGRHRIVQDRPADQPATAPTLKFLFQDEGSATISQGGRIHRIHAGQWCAVRKDLPFALEAPDHSRQLAITMPCALLAGLRRGADWWRQPRGSLRGPAFVLHATASALLLAGGSFLPADREQLARQLVALADMTVRADDAAAQPDMREARRRAILEHVESNLADPRLSVGEIARAFGWSNRTVHKLFEGEVQTISRAIWDRRLDRCRDDMADPGLASRSITEIAHLWGFSDSQHFSRAFKLRFGETPRDYRNRVALH